MCQHEKIMNLIYKSGYKCGYIGIAKQVLLRHLFLIQGILLNYCHRNHFSYEKQTYAMFTLWLYHQSKCVSFHM